MPDPAAAFFDVDGTLTRTTILHPLAWYNRARLGPGAYAAWSLGVLLSAPRYLWTDRRSRSRVQALIFRRYAGLDAGGVRAWHAQEGLAPWLGRLFPAARARVDEHRRRGDRVVLVTGGLDFAVEPLARHLEVDDLLAARLEERDGRFTGVMAGEPVADERKAVLVREYARRHGLDLDRSAAYTDSHGDVPLLECVGRPAAVNPDRRLEALARRRGWEIARWTLASPGQAAAPARR